MDPAREMIRLESISKQNGQHLLFVEASAALARGEKVGLVGPNGAGKTTLFRMITGEDPPDEGQVSVERGVKADTSMMSRFFRKIGVTFKKRPWSRKSRIARTSDAIVRAGEPIRGSLTPNAWFSSTRPGRRRT